MQTILDMRFRLTAILVALVAMGIGIVAALPAPHAIAAEAPARDARVKSKPLNVLFIISDDLRTEVGCYGSIAKTPNIDALAKAGVRFDGCYCQYPLCNPSRSSMLTGRYPVATGVLGNRTWFGEAHPDFVSMPKYFKQQGYVTLRTGKIFHGGIDDTEAWTEGGEPRVFGGSEDQGQAATGTLPSADPDEARPFVAAGDSKAKVETTAVDGKSESNSEGQGDQPKAEKGTKAAKGAKGVKGAANATGVARAQQSDRIIVLDGDGATHGDSRCADRAIDFLRRYKDSDKPFFLGCGFVKPHSPPTAPKKFFDMYDLAKIELPPNFAPRPTIPEGFPKDSIRPKNADLFIGRDATPEEAKEMIRAYLASASFVDWNVGRVIAELDKLGLRDNTIIVFWGDHGYQLGERGKWSKAGSLFEQGDRTPFIVVDPRAKGNGQPCPRVVECVDFYPTFCDLVGLPKPKELEGRSFAQLLDNPKAPFDFPAYTIWSEDGKTIQGVALRDEKWRYAEFEGGKGGAMLFDEAADPKELKNLANDPKYADVVAKFSPLAKAYASRLDKK